MWGALAHPAYAAFQVVWLVALAARWRASDRLVRVQLAGVALAAVVATAALVVGLVGWGSPRAGLLSVWLVPVAAGWAIVHGEHLVAYSALSWLSRTGSAAQDLPVALARAAAQALQAPRAVVWAGSSRMRPVGVWPTGGDVDATDLEVLRARPGLAVLPVVRDGSVLGALTVERPATAPLSPAQQRLAHDLAGQAALVLAHVSLLQQAAPARAGRDVDALSPREREVLTLMARGLSNAAIGRELHLSIKTVEPVVGSIFTKLGLDADAASNRRVLAVLTYWRT